MSVIHEKERFLIQANTNKMLGRLVPNWVIVQVYTEDCFTSGELGNGLAEFHIG